MTQLRVFLALTAIAASSGAAAQTASSALQAESAALAVPAPTSSTRLVALNGTVTGQPESVAFAGQAKVSSRLAKDPDFGAPRLVLTIDLTGVAGTGASSRARYVISGPELVQRRVAAVHQVEITFPFVKNGSGDLAQTGVASLALGFDTDTGAVTSASGTIASPNFPR